MTPEERTENIKMTLLPLIDLGPRIVDFIVDQISEAYAEGFAAAKKKASEIARHSLYGEEGKRIADRISRMETEDKYE